MGKKTDPNAVENQQKLTAAFMPRFRQAKRLSGLKQKEIAKRLGTTESCVSQWMNGKALPGTVYIPALARELRVSTDWLLGMTDDGDSLEEKLERLAKLELALGVIKLAVEDAESANGN